MPIPTKTTSLATFVIASLAFSIGNAPSASATPNTFTNIISSISPGALGNLFAQPARARAFPDSIRPEIPVHSSDPLKIQSMSGASLDVWLPESVPATSELVGNIPVSVFDTADEFALVPLPKNDGSLQILTVIESENAPERFEYRIEIPAFGSMEVVDDVVVIRTASGKFAAGVSPAWAKDALGNAVPTHFTVDGNLLIQTIEHKGSSFDYPIVADPWLGQDLYYTPQVLTVTKGYQIAVKPRTWGTTWAGVSTWWAHRDEVVNKLGTKAWRWSGSIQEQFYCHIAGLPFSLPEYNMDSWRPLVNWSVSLTVYKCNP